MEIKRFALGPLGTNCYIAYTDTQAIAIDPGGNPKEVISWLAQKELKLTHILNTHLHFDHVSGNKALTEATDAPILACDKDQYLLDTELGKGGFMGLPLVPPYTYDPICEGELDLLGTTCKVIHTPGHSKGSVSFYFAKEGVLFSGDLIFYRSVGRTDFPGSDTETLKESILTKIYTLPEETIIYPGHEIQTTVGDERNHNTVVRV
ncbi:MAG: MBL fold metallo-hydrolase [Desulfovibrio sp.]